MEPKPNNVTERILQLTLEIIYLLTGEDDIVVKKPSGDGQDPIMVPLHSLPIPEKNNEQKILEVTKKIIDLLTKESGNWSRFNVSIKEEIKGEEKNGLMEWERLEEHKGVMTENRPPLTSPDGSRDPPQRCPCPLDSQDSTQEDHTIPCHEEGEEVMGIKIEVKEEEEETYVMGEQLSVKEDEMMETIPKEESPLDISPGEPNGCNTPDGHFILSTDCNKEDDGMTQYTPGVSTGTQKLHHKLNHMVRSTDQFIFEESIDKPHSIIPNVQPSFHSADRSSDPFNPEDSNCKESSLNTLRSSEDCQQPFIKKPDLVVVHRRIYTSEKPFSCPECQKSFIKKSYLVQHQKIHTSEKPFSCTECEKSFTRKSILVEHQRVHASEKPFSCSECEKSFIKKSNLVAHQRIHASEKPFFCYKCKKSFTKKSGLVQHQRIHTGEKPYSCSECGKSFTEKSHLNTHHRVHTGEKPYPCSECGKCFADKGNRDKHMRLHTGEKPFSCQDCGKSFAQKVKLIIHQRTHTS